MASLLRDSSFGNLCRILTNGRVFRYQEEIHPELWHRYVNTEKSANVARHGRTGSRDSSDDLNDSSHAESPPRVTNVPSRSWEEDGQIFQGMTGEEVDPEKGLNVLIVDWWDDKDPEVSFHVLICLDDHYT